MLKFKKKIRPQKVNKWQEDRNSGVNKNIRQQRVRQRVGLLKQNMQNEKEINEQLMKMAESVMFFLIMPEKMK